MMIMNFAVAQHATIEQPGSQIMANTAHHNVDNTRASTPAGTDSAQHKKAS
jgi:hypothetical protein